MHSRFVSGATAASAALLGVLAVACSTSSPNGSGNGSLVAVTDAGFAGCEPIAAGCYTVSGTYPLPASTGSCAQPGGPATGAADTHCVGVPAQAVSPASCSLSSEDAGPASTDDGGTATPTPTAGACGENSGDYGTTMYGSSGSDDDCKYKVSYTTSPLCENDGTYLVVQASYLSSGEVVTGACTYAETCLSDTHPGPAIDSRPPQGKQTVVEGPPGTYTIGPVVFDAPGQWTVRFHFNEECCDVAGDSPHGHAAFFLNVP